MSRPAPLGPLLGPKTCADTIAAARAEGYTAGVLAEREHVGERICQHEHRIHPLGAGIYVCFACWCRLLLGRRQ